MRQRGKLRQRRKNVKKVQKAWDTVAEYLMEVRPANVYFVDKHFGRGHRQWPDYGLRIYAHGTQETGGLLWSKILRKPRLQRLPVEKILRELD